MGSPKGGSGYDQVSAMDPKLASLVQSILAQYSPGGTGMDAITKQANENFQQQTVPDILSQYGGDNKGSSYLNSALAGASSKLNTDLAAQRSQQQLAAAQIAGGIPQNALTPKGPGKWGGAASGAVQGAGAGTAFGPWGTLVGGLIGGGAGYFGSKK